MPRVVRTAQAKLDAVNIWCYMAEDNEAAADGLIDQIGDRLQQLAAFAESGEAVSYLRSDVRRSTIGNRTMK